ncbi:pyrin [Gracilinanus agilis]|uniref:pyrin n=1 Tax=Gracilinanus agilis TaxID=191870 RepID=UPI001CFD34C6|nr:pyrin [Gracilinanus agilis]
MAKTLSDHLLHTLESLVAYDLEKFKFKLQNANLDKDRVRIPHGRLQNATGSVKLAALLINYYGERYAVKLTLQVLQAINQNLLVEELSQAITPECLTQECATEISGTSAISSTTGSRTLEITVPLKGILENEDADFQGPNEDIMDGIQVPISSSQLHVGQEYQEDTLETDASLVLESNRYENSEVAVTLRQKAYKNQAPLFLSAKRISNQEFGDFSGEQNHPNQKSMNKVHRNSEVSVSLGESAMLYKHQVPESLKEKIFGNVDTSMLSGKKETKNPGNQYLKEACEDEPRLRRTPTEAFNFLRITGAPFRAASLRRVQESCSICQAMVANPSNISWGNNIRYYCNVGHNVCLKCQAMFPKNFQHSRSLENIPTDFQEPKLSPQSMPQCECHPKQLQGLFCKEHGKTICLICSMSQEHRGHRMLPIEKAAQSYKEQIQSQLEHLKKVRETAEEKKSQGNKTITAFLNKTEAQKKQIMSQLKQLHHFLEEQERLFVVWLEELYKTIFRSKEEYIMKASLDISLLEELMGELEEKQKQPAWEFLQDIRVTLMRAEWAFFPEEWTLSPELKEKTHLLFWKSANVERSMRQFIVSLQSEMETFKILQLREVQLYSANVTLDPETAHPKLIISDDRKHVRFGKKCGKVFNGPQRFDDSVIVLGFPSFTSGKHYWQVDVGDKTSWILGVCKNSVNRKGSIAFSPGNGFWLIMMTKKNEYSASTIPPTPLSLREPPRCVGIFMDFEAGDISFYNVTAKSHIYTFSFSSSSSGPLRPIFSPGIQDRGKNTDPLTICSVNR